MFKINSLSKWESGVGPYKSIVWHHSLTEDGDTLNDYAAIKRYHKNVRGWRDIGYNIIIERDGPNGAVVAKWGRPLGMSAAHCKQNRRNYNSIGICIVGNYDIGSGEELTPEHFLVAKEVVDVLENFLQVELQHEKHSDHATYKTCPGSAFPFEALVNYVKQKNIDTDVSKWAKESWDKAVANGINDGLGAKNNVTEEQLVVFFDRLGLLD